MRKLLFMVVIMILLVPFAYMQGGQSSVQVIESSGSQWEQEPARNIQSPQSQSTDTLLRDAFNNHQSNLQVQGESVVSRILPDDTKGSRHQKFILRLSHGQTILVAHNIDLAPRIRGLEVGDTVEFYGEYEWNEKGGVIHWTHHDPDGRHVGGWLMHDGNVYQ